MQEKELTTEEKRLKKIEQLKAKLQQEQARLSTARRKERDGQLVAWGVYVEALIKHLMMLDASASKIASESTLRAGILSGHYLALSAYNLTPCRG